MGSTAFAPLRVTPVGPRPFRFEFNGAQASYGNGVTIGLSAPDVAAVDAFHERGLAAGGSDEGAPGPRPAIPNSYAAYVRDPTGNKLVAWCVRES